MDVLLLILSREFEKFRPDLHEKRVKFQGSTKTRQTDPRSRPVESIKKLPRECRALVLFHISEIPGYEDARPLFAKFVPPIVGLKRMFQEIRRFLKFYSRLLLEEEARFDYANDRCSIKSISLISQTLFPK